jgi:UDP-hydrolysing UDP-N-acetyl-D-glucosamine 2-epimerase
MTRKIMVFISGRADESPLHGVMGRLLTSPALDCKAVFSEVMPETIGACADWTSAQINAYRPDLCLILGDRIEALAAAYAATYHRVPIAHVHGGEVTHGSFDNQIRDAVTKLSHIHLVAHEWASRRVRIDLGEDKSRVHIVGAPGLDAVSEIMREPEPEPTNEFILTWHPPTLEEDPVYGLKEIIAALQPVRWTRRMVWTGTNNDPGSELINAVVNGWVKSWSDFLEIADKMDYQTYLRRVRAAALVIGNSSSGIIETPTLHTPSVTVGHRQSGRISGPSVYHAEEDEVDIQHAIEAALYGKHTWDNPYFFPHASESIVDILATVDLKGILVK